MNKIKRVVFILLMVPLNIFGQDRQASKPRCPYAHSQNKNVTQESKTAQALTKPESIDSVDLNEHVKQGNSRDSTNKKFLCPFLTIAQPDTTGYKEFAKSCEEAGMDYNMAKFVAKDIGARQLGKKAVKEGKTPDLMRLDEVDGISHADLYQKYLEQVAIWMENKEVDGKVTLQDLVKIKQYIARLESVEIQKSSKIETALLFIGAGGNLENWTVKSSDVLLFLNHDLPSVPIEVTIKKLRKTRRKANWK